MPKLIDIHSHIIYGVDDGPKTFADSQVMLYRAAENNISDIVCTSHAAPGIRPFPAKEYIQHMEEEQRFCDDQALGITLHYGAEIFYTELAPRMIRDGAIPTMDETWYVLLAFERNATLTEISDALHRIEDIGHYPILAHVERLDCMRNVKTAVQLKKSCPVLYQLNSDTVLKPGTFMDERWLRHMFSEQLIDFVASDSHNAASRDNTLMAAYRKLCTMLSPAAADRLCGGKASSVLKIERSFTQTGPIIGNL